MLTYSVIIDNIEEREESFAGTCRARKELTFRGACKVEDWEGKKKFFASQCRSIVDGKTGQVIEGHDAVLNWLRKLVIEQEKVAMKKTLTLVISFSLPTPKLDLWPIRKPISWN